MTSVSPELTAVNALRAYLLRVLPAHAAAINAQRAASITLPRAGPYVLPAGSVLGVGVTQGAEPAVPLTSGSRTATQVVAELTAAAVPGLVFSVDSRDRVVATATAAPTDGVQSVVSFVADVATPALSIALGLDPGGNRVVRCAIQAPDSRGVYNGSPTVVDLGRQFWVMITNRTTEPRSGNTRDDTHRVLMQLEVLAAEPNYEVDAMAEYIESCARAVHGALLDGQDGRTLDGAVHLCEVPRMVVAGTVVKWARDKQSGVSPIMGKADITVRVTVFERT